MNQEEIRQEAIRLAPPAGVSVTSVMGVPLSDWVYIATIIYIFIQCICIVHKTFKKKQEEETNVKK